MTAAEDELHRAGASEASLATFRRHYERLRSGASGTSLDAEQNPVRGLPELAALPRPNAHPALVRARGPAHAPDGAVLDGARLAVGA